MRIIIEIEEGRVIRTDIQPPVGAAVVTRKHEASAPAEHFTPVPPELAKLAEALGAESAGPAAVEIGPLLKRAVPPILQKPFAGNPQVLPAGAAPEFPPETRSSPE